MNRILFLAVNYRSNDDALRLAESIDRLEDRERIDLLIVDNSDPPDREHLIYRRERTGFALVGDGRNRGYFGGAYYGLCAYESGGGERPEWVIVGNCDLQPAADDLVARLDALAPQCAREKIGVLAPTIRSARSGADQNPFYPEAPSARRYLGLSMLFRSYPLAIAYRLLAHGRQRLKTKSDVGAAGVLEARDPRARDIFAGHGSCMLFHRCFFEAGGTLEYQPFLYCEEVHVGAQARRLGVRVRYEPTLSFDHREHGAIRLFPNKQVIAHLADAHYYAYRNYLRDDEAVGTALPDSASLAARQLR